MQTHAPRTPDQHAFNSEPPRTVKPFDFRPATRVVFGPDSLTRLGELAREIGGTRGLIVTDPGIKAAGHAERALDVLQRAGVQTWLFDRVQENPTTEHVELCVQAARRHAIDFLVAVGGGSSMDCAKGTNFILTNGGTMADYQGFGRASRPMLPSIGVPTTAGTGSEAQSYALIADARTHMKMACGDPKVAFRAAILDPQLTVSQPAQVTSATAIDAVAHALESYVCTRRNPFSQAFARAAWQLFITNLETVFRNPADLEARGALQVGAHLAGMAIETSMLGVCHACANPLTAYFGVTHGLAIGIMLPHVLRFNAPAVGALYADLAGDLRPVNGDERAAAEALALQVTAWLTLAQMPTRLKSLAIGSDALPVLAEEASKQWTARFNPRPVQPLDLLHLYEAAL